MQVFALPLVELCEFPSSLFLQLIELLLDDNTALYPISHSSHFCVLCNFAGVELHLIVRSVMKVFKLYRPQYNLLQYNTGDWPLAGLFATDLDFVIHLGWQFTQFSFHLTVHLRSSYFISFSLRMFWEIILEVLLKP